MQPARHSNGRALRLHAIAALVLLSQALVVTPTWAQEVWSDCEPNSKPLRYRQLAELLAPALWFSPDEPLLGPARRLGDVNIPGELPPIGADPATTGSNRVVYFKISQLRTADQQDSSAELALRRELAQPRTLGHEKVPLDRLASVRVRYLFYYPDDVGFGAHQHDLEAVEVDAQVHRVRTGSQACRAITLRRVVGAAHGADWYSNILELDESEADDVVLPLVVLVEEGKHASAPDRNADGWFTPGYDATKNVNDSWGVRDTLRNRFFGGRQYHAENAKDRRASPKLVFPPNAKGFHGASGQTILNGASGVMPEHHYALEEGGSGASAIYCKDGKVVELPAQQSLLGGFLDKWQFCEGPSIKGQKGVGSWLADRLFVGPEGPGKKSRKDRASFGYAMTGGHGHESAHGFTAAGGGALRFPLTAGWLVPRFGFYWLPEGAHALSLDLLYAPSGSRIVDWYVSAGVDNRLGDARRPQLVEELGLKIRFPSGVPFNSLVGVRFGYRGPLHTQIDSGRWVVEAGFGGW